MTAALKRLAGIGAVLVVWQAIASSGLLPAAHFPGVIEVAGAAKELLASGEFWRNESLTVLRALAGLGIAVVLALALALVAARYERVGRALAPLVELCRSMPPAPLVPLAIFALGLGAQLYMFIIVFACLWPVYVGAANALAVPEPVQVQAARSIGLDAEQVLWRVRLPAALPEIFTAIRLAASVSLLAAIVAEMLAGQDGLGTMLFQSAFSLRTAETFALLFATGINGILFNQALNLVRRPAVGWHDQIAELARA